MDSLGQRSALSDGDDITLLDSEARRAVSDDVCVSLLVSVVLLDEVEVVSSDDDGVSHLVGDDHGSENLSSDADISSEGALLVDVVSLDGLLGGFEAESDLPVVSDSLSSLGEEELFVVLENTGLFLISLFFLFDHIERFIIFRFII